MAIEIIHPLAAHYAAAYSKPEDDLLRSVAEQTRNEHPEAHMLSGHLQGKFLEQLSCLLQPRRILEVGTFTGYSALCLAKGLASDGLLHTIEIRERDAATARGHFDRSPFGSKIILHVGPAAQILPQIQEEWDLVFLDADKTGYIEYFNLVFPRLRKNGIILADNVLFHGQVMDPSATGKSVQAIRSFNDFIRSRDDLEAVILTIRDGLSLIRKTS